MKKYEWIILLKVLLLVASNFLMIFFFMQRMFIYELFVVPVFIFQINDFFRLHKKAQQEVEDFAESVHYRDFSRHFNVMQAPTELQPLRKGFNDINSAFKIISKERETQYQYLQKILELVNTGILSYEIESGEVVWMNESLKNLFQIPYLKTIQSLDKRNHLLCCEIVALKPGENKVSTLHREKNAIKILMSATAFQTGGNKYKLIAFQNVNEALDETENKAWQKLLNVMMHEIMNSIAPISSLAETLKHRLKKSKNSMDDVSIMDDVETGINTIKKRSEGLLKFAETYRNLNKINTLNLKKIYVRDLIENLYQLMKPTLEQKKIELKIVLNNPDMQFEADTNLIEQVLINLMVNAIEAVKERQNPKIVLSAYEQANNKICLQILDNGTGMNSEVLDKIFVPFFSTKRNGNGIGLSLCKQIMMLHKGTIQVKSAIDEGTAFEMHFS